MSNKLFVGSLSWDTTDQGLRDFFATIGEVTSAKVIMDRNSGRSKGFGFVEMASAEDAQRAMDELNGKSLDGRAIVVSEARPQAPRDNRGGGRSYGGGYDRNRGGDDRGGRDW